MAESKCTMDVGHSNLSSPDQGLHESFSAFLNTVNLVDYWPLEGEYDMHICLKCLTNVAGLSKYLLHKLRDCPKLTSPTIKAAPSIKPDIATESVVEIIPPSVLDEQLQQQITLTKIDFGTSDQTFELKNEDHVVCMKNDDEDIHKALGCSSPQVQKSDDMSSSKKRGKQAMFNSSKPILTSLKVHAFACEPCGLTCASKASLVYHLASSEHWRTSSKHPDHRRLILAHSEELAPLAPYRCSICPFYFNKLEDLADHCMKESEIHKRKLGQYRQLLCTSCKFRCWTIEELLKHFHHVMHAGKSPQDPVILSGTDEFFCTKCNWTCKRQHALLFHIKWKHSGEIDCKECQITFDEEEALNQHMMEIKHKKNLFSCSLCPFVGRSKLSFQDHLMQGHNKGVQKSVCDVNRKVQMNVENASNKSEKNDYANVVQQFMKTVDKVPSRAIIKIQKIQTTEDVASSCSKEKGSPGPLTFVKFDGNRGSENREPFVIFVLDSAKESADKVNPETVDELFGKEEFIDLKNLHHKTSSAKSVASQKQKLSHNLCLHCDQKFDNQKALKVHLKTFHLEKLFHCEPCVATFCSKPNLESHMKSRLHACNTKDIRDIEKGLLKPTTEFSCKYCKFRTATKAGILFHEVMHAPSLNQDSLSTTSKAGIFKTNESESMLLEGMPHSVKKTENECENVLSHDLSNNDSNEGIFITSQDAEDGVYVHVVDDTNEVVVVTSKDTEQDKDLLNTGKNVLDGMLEPVANKDDCTNIEHIANDTCIKSPKLYSCPICQEPLTATKLRFHLIGHTGDQLFSCQICNASYARKASLVSHERDQHGSKKHHCPKCSFRTNRKIKLDEHLAIHEGDKRAREFPCETCGAKFYTSSAVQTHMLVHAANKGRTVHCAFKGCMKSFRYLSEMLYHKRVHSGDVSYLCELCGFATKSQQLLRKHERSHDDVKKFKCSYCSYAATHSYHLSRHMRIHCQVKPYSCPHCPFTCNSQENLRKHILNSKKHPGLKVYPCRHCDFGCNVADEMKMHTIREHHGIAKQYDEDNPAFASLVTGIFKPESDLKVPSEQPAPYIPVKERQRLSKQMRSAAEKSKSKLVVHNLGNDIDWLHQHKAEAVKDNCMHDNEVDIAVENLVEMTEWKLETSGNSVKRAKIDCSDNSKSPDGAILNKNVLQYQLFDDTDITFVKEEMVPMDVQEVTVWAVADS